MHFNSLKLRGSCLALFIILFTLTGCLPGWGTEEPEVVSEESISTAPAPTALRPPQWLQGTWRANLVYTYEYTFTPNSVISESMGTRTDYGELLESGRIEVNETASSSRYTITIQYPDSNGTQSHSFTRIDANSVRHALHDDIDGVHIEPLMLFRVEE